MENSNHMESEKLYLLNEFRDQLVNFLDEIIEQFPRECDFVLIRMFIKDQLPVADIMGRFIRDILPLREHVTKRDDDFFLNNSILYTGGNINLEKVDHFKEIWMSDTLDEEDRTVIWKWMDCLFLIAEKYKQKFGYIHGWDKSISS
jgi:hypothetical protein